MRLDALQDLRVGMVRALIAMKGFQSVAAMILVSELGEVDRFAHSRQVMAYLGLVPSEHSSGGKRRQGGITKAGNGTARRMHGSPGVRSMAVQARGPGNAAGTLSPGPAPGSKDADDATLELARRAVEEALNAVTARAYELADGATAGDASG